MITEDEALAKIVADHEDGLTELYWLLVDLDAPGLVYPFDDYSALCSTPAKWELFAHLTGQDYVYDTMTDKMLSVSGGAKSLVEFFLTTKGLDLLEEVRRYMDF